MALKKSRFKTMAESLAEVKIDEPAPKRKYTRRKITDEQKI